MDSKRNTFVRTLARPVVPAWNTLLALRRVPVSFCFPDGRDLGGALQPEQQQQEQQALVGGEEEKARRGARGRVHVQAVDGRGREGAGAVEASRLDVGALERIFEADLSLRLSARCSALCFELRPDGLVLAMVLGVRRV